MLGIYKIIKSSYVIQIKRTEWDPANWNSTMHLVLSFWNVEFSLWKWETLFSLRLFGMPLNIYLRQVRWHARVNDLRLTLRVCSVLFATALNNLKSSLFGQEIKESLRRRSGCSALDQLTLFTWTVLQNMSQLSIEVCRLETWKYEFAFPVLHHISGMFECLDDYVTPRRCLLLFLDSLWFTLCEQSQFAECGNEINPNW